MRTHRSTSNEVVSAAPDTMLTIQYTDVNGMKQVIKLPADHVIIATATSTSEQNQFVCLTWGDGPTRSELLLAVVDTLDAQGLNVPIFALDLVEGLPIDQLLEFVLAMKISGDSGPLADRMKEEE